MNFHHASSNFRVVVNGLYRVPDVNYSMNVTSIFLFSKGTFQ